MFLGKEIALTSESKFFFRKQFKAKKCRINGRIRKSNPHFAPPNEINDLGGH